MNDPYVFTDKDGNEYISTPEIDLSIELTIVYLIGALSPYWIAAALWLA